MTKPNTFQLFSTIYIHNYTKMRVNILLSFKSVSKLYFVVHRPAVREKALNFALFYFVLTPVCLEETAAFL